MRATILSQAFLLRDTTLVGARESTPMSEPYELGVAETARLIADRKLSVVELVETLLHRIDQLEFLKAWQYVDPDAVRAVALQKQADLDVASATPSLFGVPVGLKDIFCTA